ncbi:hypothetical protein SCB49_08488 [unidentified eubacterium SCB49]|nr:hypothetical protein SCB49_08488 [unidentified eubacterium SCB49]
MKKFLSVIAFAFIFALGSQSVNAQSLSQNGNRPEAIAKIQLAELDKSLDFTADQERTLFRAFVQKEVNYKRYVNNDKVSAVDAKANKAKYDAAFDQAMRKALTDGQYAKWKAMDNN